MTLHTWLAFMAATMVVLIIPGPTVLLVIGDALANRSRSAWGTVAGVGVGDGLAMAFSLAGAGALLQASAAAFTFVKILGGLYLIFLGIRSILNARRSAQTVPDDCGGEPTSAGTVTRFGKACTVTLLNPKSILFFVAFVPQFISTRESFLHQSVILLITFVFLAMVNVTAYAALARYVGKKLLTPSARRKVAYASGGTLITAGALTLAVKHR
jgi:threonine/homoserine/homoserine lactone efflux protein